MLIKVIFICRCNVVVVNGVNSKKVMKTFISYFAVTMFCFLSCKKDTSSTQKGTFSITGKWSIITDSSFAGVGSENHLVNYTGQEGDYFDFAADGKLYVKENNIINTYNYTLTSPATLIIDSFGITINGVPNTSVITYETPHTIILYTPFIMTPGGTFGRKVHLTR
jgi:hypothetical protein